MPEPLSCRPWFALARDDAQMADADTPITDAALIQYDDLAAIEAVVQAWTAPGPHRGYHAAAAEDVRERMPLLGRALDRLAAEHPEWCDLRWRPIEP